jgi:hypothetical protein
MGIENLKSANAVGLPAAFDLGGNGVNIEK